MTNSKQKQSKGRRVPPRDKHLTAAQVMRKYFNATPKVNKKLR